MFNARSGRLAGRHPPRGGWRSGRAKCHGDRPHRPEGGRDAGSEARGPSMSTEAATGAAWGGGGGFSGYWNGVTQAE